MARHLFVVSREHERLYEYLVDRFRDDPKVEVILDRRAGERRRERPGWPGEEADRRGRADLDEQLRARSHVILTISDPEDMEHARG